MRFGLDVPTTGEFADARVLAHLAAEAETAGWDGFFIWDVLLQPGERPSVDPWVALVAIAMQTAHMRLGLLVTPLARDRPWLVARRLANLDHLTQGRMVCTVGLGHQEHDFAAFGESAEPHIRAQRLDEGLALLDGLWTTDQFNYTGMQYTLTDVTLRPRPVQQPRIPLWVAAGWPLHAPLRRAAQWDGLCLKSRHVVRQEPLTLADFHAALAYVRSQRTHDGPFDIIMSGETWIDLTPEQIRATVLPFAEAGATWWMEEGLGYSLAEFTERIRRGPPAIA